jgi:ABC-2 type transport system ATP-binding protein
MADNPIFKVNNVSKYYGEKVILSNISFDIMPGEILGLIGASGTGKTTLLNMLIGFIRPDKGEILFRFEHLLNLKENQLYRNVIKKPIEVKKMIGFAAQVPSFYPNLTVQENLEYFGSLFNMSRDALLSNIDALLDLMELKACRHQLAKNLSGGMQRRLDIACSLVHDPKVLILDEPTADLDPILRKHILSLVKLIKEKGTTVILSTHHLSEIENLCDRIAILKNGSIIEINTFSNIREKFITHKKLTIETNSKDYSKLLHKIPNALIHKQDIDNNELVIRTNEPNKLIRLLLKRADYIGEEINTFSLGTPNLDEIFVSITKIDDERIIKKLRFLKSVILDDDLPFKNYVKTNSNQTNNKNKLKNKLENKSKNKENIPNVYFYK